MFVRNIIGTWFRFTSHYAECEIDTIGFYGGAQSMGPLWYGIEGFEGLRNLSQLGPLLAYLRGTPGFLRARICISMKPPALRAAYTVPETEYLKEFLLWES